MFAPVYRSGASHFTYSTVFSLRTRLEDKDFSEWEIERRRDWKFDCCKTRYEQPLDSIVRVCLAIAKHHLGDLIHISSDGRWETDWRGTRSAITKVFGKEKLEGVFLSDPPRDEVPRSALKQAVEATLAP